MLRSAQKSSMILISKSFNTAQAQVVTALAGVVPMNFRALELSIQKKWSTSKLAEGFESYHEWNELFGTS